MGSALIEARLAVAEEHIAQGERHVARQRELVELRLDEERAVPRPL